MKEGKKVVVPRKTEESLFISADAMQALFLGSKTRKWKFDFAKCGIRNSDNR